MNETESSANVISLAEKHGEKFVAVAHKELILAIAALKDAERHLLKAHRSLVRAETYDMLEPVLTRLAGTCQKMANTSLGFLRFLGERINRTDPFQEDAT